MEASDAATLIPWHGRAILLVDLDAFFASVEELDHPEWRGKPVIVGGDPDKRGVVSTANYAARGYGVHSAMASAQARRLCPDAIWTHGDFKRYTEMSNLVMQILLAESPLLQQVSIDEAFLDVSPGKYVKEHPVAIANRIRGNVEKLGITCSVGVGTSKTVAKIASDMDKPDGITVVFPGTERNFLSPLPIRSISGIGRRSAEKLTTLGIATLGQLASCDTDLLRDIFGVNTRQMQDRCRGIDPVEIDTERDVKSVSNEMTFSTDMTQRAEMEQAIRMMAAKVGRRLRRKQLAGHTVTLKLKYDDLSVRTSQRRLSSATDDETVFSEVACDLIDDLWMPGDRVRLLGVGIAGFDEKAVQLGLFDEGSDGEGNRKLVEATDKVKNRFGENAISYGRDLRFKERTSGTAPEHKDEFH